MLPNLHSVYLEAEARSRFFGVALVLLLGTAIFGIAFFSPALVLGLTFAVVVVLVSFWKPQTMLMLFSFYLPFEPFLLKWVPDELYVFARYGSEVLIYVLVAATLAHILFGEAKVRRSPADVPFVLFCVITCVSAILNLVPMFQALLGIRQILRFVILFFVTLFLAPTKRWLKWFLLGIGAIMLIQVVLAGGQSVIGAPLDTFLLPGERRTSGSITLTSGTVQFWDPGQRVFGTMGRYDQLGTFLAFFLLVGVALLYEKAIDERYRAWLWLLAIVTLPILALTYSRSAWFGFLLGFLFIAAYIKKDKRVIAVSLLIPFLLGLYLSFTGLVVHQLIDVPRQSLSERFFEAFSFERWRGEYYGLGRVFWMVKTINTVVPYSPIFGVGPARFGAGAVAALHDTTVYDTLGLPFGVYGTEGYIDNNWFSLLGETGLLGLFAYLWLYSALFFACLHVALNSKDRATRALALGVAAGMIAMALNALLATMLETRTLAPYIWIMTGMVVSLGKKEKLL
jgi:hypothetical protein